MIKIRILIWLQHCYLAYRPHLDITITSLKAKENSRTCIAFNCDVSLVLFNLGCFISLAFSFYIIDIYEGYTPGILQGLSAIFSRSNSGYMFLCQRCIVLIYFSSHNNLLSFYRGGNWCTERYFARVTHVSWQDQGSHLGHQPKPGVLIFHPYAVTWEGHWN